MIRENSYGDYRTTRAADWRAFDALPRVLRDAVNYAVGSFASEPLRDAHRAGIANHKLIAAIRRDDFENTAKTYGHSHPEAVQPQGRQA